MVLFIYRSRAEGTSVSEIFNIFGIPSLVTSPENAIAAISNKFRAIIISIPKEELRIYDEEYIKSLKIYSIGSPVFAICEKNDTTLYSNIDAFDGIFTKADSPAHILKGIQDYQYENGLPYTGVYRLACIDASINLSLPEYLDIPIPLTTREKLILRTLMRLYPSSASSKDILKYAFRESRVPEPSDVRAHICGINKKFKDVIGRKIIEMASDRSGYIITTQKITSDIT